MTTSVLYNPKAGNRKSQEEAHLISLLFEGQTTCTDITTINDWHAFFQELDDEDDTVVICGGDGTLNHFVNDTAEINIRCNILYHAAGSGNDFLKDLGKQPDDHPFRINKYLKNLPTVEVNGKTYRFLNGVGYGIDGYCCEVGDKIKETSNQAANYTAIAIKGLLFHFKPTNATVTVDGESYEYRKVWIAPTMKGRYYGGGMMPTPNQDRMDPGGTLTLMVFHGSGKLKTLMVFPSLFKGEHVKHKKIIALHEGKDITVTFDRPTSLQIDGETILNVTSYRALAHTAVPAKV